MLAWLCVWVKVQICIWLSWCHCHSLSFAPVNPDWFYLLVLHLWCQLTRVVPDKIQEGCKTVVCVCVWPTSWKLQYLLREKLAVFPSGQYIVGIDGSLAFRRYSQVLDRALLDVQCDVVLADVDPTEALVEAGKSLAVTCTVRDPVTPDDRTG